MKRMSGSSKQAIVAVGLGIALASVAFGDTWKDAEGGTPEFEKDNTQYSSPMVISGESGAVKDDNSLGFEDTATGAKAVKWYEWTAPKSGTVWFWTQGNNFNTFLGAYAYGTTDDIAHNDNFAGSASRIAFQVTMGTKYTLYVGGADPNYLGEYTLKWRMGSPVTVTFDSSGGAMDIGFGGNVWDTKVKLSATPKPGYVFRSWNSDLVLDSYDASCRAFPKFNTQRRKNATPTVTVQKDSPISFTANFVKKTEDTMSIQVTAGSTTLYAEDGAGSVELSAESFSYPKVTTSKLPAGVRFSLLPPPTSPYVGRLYDFEYKLEIVNPDKVPAGRNIIKIRAKNRSGKTATKSIVVWGKNKTSASANGALSVFGGVLVKDPNEIYVGVKYKLSDWGVLPASGWKITKIGGLPAGITWDAKNRKLKGYTKKTGLFTFTFTVAKGKTTYVQTATFKVSPLPAKAVGTFYGYAAPDEFGTFFNSSSRKVTVSVTAAGKVTAKVGDASFYCDGLSYNPDGMKFVASMKTSVKDKKKNATRVRTLGLEFQPFADFCENSLEGRFCDYFTKKTAHSITEDLVAQCNIVGRKNVFGYDDYGNQLFEGADLAQDALNQATLAHQFSYLTFAGGDVGVTLTDSCNGLATLTGTINGKAFSESAVVWYESINETKALLVVHSFNLGTTISYVVTIVQDYSGPYASEVGAPNFPAG